MKPPLQAYQLFFPAAALYALAAIPLWALEYAGFLPPWRESGWASWHGHEMLFGYALAVVGGYLLTKPSRAAVWISFAAWLIGRFAYFAVGLPPPLEAAIALAYPVCLFAFAGLPFLRAAKSGRNLVFAGILAALVLAALAYESGVLGDLAAGEARGTALGIDAIALLMLVMGGRIIAAATSGALRLKDIRLRAPAQPRLETAGIVAIVSLMFFEFLGAPVAAAVSAAAAAIVVALRLVNWRTRHVMDDAELAALHIGYAWIGIGLAAKAASLGFGVPSPADALHGIMIGALGTLSLAMMARASLQRSRRPIVYPPSVTLAIAMISGAALCRLLAAVPVLRLPMVGMAGVFWTAAFAIFAVFLLRLLRTPSETRVRTS